MKLLNFGSLNLDHIYHVDHFVEGGETISSSALNTFCGGKGLNQSISLAKVGIDVWHAGSIGINDGDILLDMLKKSGVHTEYVNYKNISTGHAIIQKNKTGENCIILYGGANQEITEDDVEKTLSNFKKGDFLVLQNEINLLDFIIRKAKQIGMTIVLNPSPMNEKLLSCPLEFVDYFILNEIEAEQICGKKKNFNECLFSLHNIFPKAKFVLTLGSKGSMFYDGTDMIEQRAYETNVVDTTAAGDTFLGFFVGNIMLNRTVEESLALASMAASIACSRLGAAPSIPNVEEVDQMIKQI
jgi:ribokinase